MHEMIDGVILRNLVQESSKSKLQLQRYGKKNFGDLFVISGKSVGVYLKIFSKIRGLLGIFGIVA
jgi:hypothetical protein